MKGSLFLLIAAVFPLCWLLSARASDLGVIDVRYDKFDDITKVSTVESKISDALGRRQENQDLRFKVAYECTGETTHCRPERVEFRFLSQSVGEYSGSDQLIFIVDGKRIRSGVRWKGEYGRSVLVEYITATLNLEEFLTLANAKKVEAKLGGTTFTFSDDNFRALRGLAGEISPTASLEKI